MIIMTTMIIMMMITDTGITAMMTGRRMTEAQRIIRCPV